MGLLAVVIGGYTLIGGLGATFYVSYFNTAIIFFLIILLMVEVFFNPFEHVNNPFGSSQNIFEFVACWKAPDTDVGNHGGSYLTFFSSGGLVFGIVNLVGNFGTVFCDQAYWQSSVAAKPLQGVWGFIAGGLCWFAIPFGLATTMGLAYLGLSSAQGAPLLSEEDIMKGLAAPLVAQKLLGPVGEYSMLFLILMAVMSTGSAEIIAVASIVIYDVYQTYICPFRREHKDGQCILCGRFLRQQKEDEGRPELNPRMSSSPTTPARHMELTRSTRSTCSTTRTGASSSAPFSPSPSASSAGQLTSTLPGRTTSLVSSSPPQSSPSPCPSSGQEPLRTAS